jgi:hypothetical protein
MKKLKIELTFQDLPYYVILLILQDFFCFEIKSTNLFNIFDCHGKFKKDKLVFFFF